jgi:hypothetical protein
LSKRGQRPMNSSNSWVNLFLAFLAGCIAGAVAFYLVVAPSMRRNAEIQTHANEARHHEDSLLQDRLDTANTALQTAQSSLQQATQARDTCLAKFDRATLLYDVGLLGGETRVWAIPADVEPLVVGQKRGSYSHFDPKTQTETVHFQAKSR